jgi:hypothetical protein
VPQASAPDLAMSVDLPEGYAALPWQGHVFIQCQPGTDDAWYLIHELTHERVLLDAPPAGSEWGLVEDEHGNVFATCSGDLSGACPVSELLRLVPLQHESLDPALALVHCQATGEVKVQQACHQEHADHAFDLLVSSPDGLSKRVSIDVALFQSSGCGASVWWDFAALWKQVGAEGCRSGSEAWWRKLASMRKCAADLELLPAHVRSGMEPGSASSKSRERVVAYHSLSTHAVLAMLARWAGDSPNKGGLRTVGCRLSARLLLLAVIAIAFHDGSHQAIPLFLDTKACWRPPAFIEGSDEIMVAIQSGLWDHAGILGRLPTPSATRGQPDLHEPVTALWGLEGKVHQLGDLLIHALQEPSLRG